MIIQIAHFALVWKQSLKSWQVEGIQVHTMKDQHNKHDLKIKHPLILTRLGSESEKNDQKETAWVSILVASITTNQNIDLRCILRCVVSKKYGDSGLEVRPRMCFDRAQLKKSIRINTNKLFTLAVVKKGNEPCSLLFSLRFENERKNICLSSLAVRCATFSHLSKGCLWDYKSLGWRPSYL